jgi:hypothetical protein
MSIKKSPSKKAKAIEKDLGLDFALKALGYLLPETEAEIIAFEQINGSTEVDLPEHLNNPDFLFEKVKEKKGKVIKLKGLAISLSDSKQVQTSAKHNDYFKKLVLAAHIAYELHEEPTFGHVKFQKIFSLCDEVCNIKLSTNYGKYAAGPLDPKLMHSIDPEFKNRRWFTIEPSKYGFRYKPDINVEDYKNYYPTYFGHQSDSILHIVNLFRKHKTAFCEKVATLFFVWKDCLNKDLMIDETNLFNGFYSWDESKSKYNKTELIEALKWMKENNIVPVN